MDDQLVNLDTGVIDWDGIKKLIKDTDQEDTTHKCKRCKKTFYCKNYNGNYPLCDDHRNNTFKK